MFINTKNILIVFSGWAPSIIMVSLPGVFLILMKADNKKIVKRNMMIYFGVISVCLSFTLLGLVIQVPKYKFICLGIVLIISYIMIKINDLRFFEIDNSGELITIKHYHPFKRGKIWPVFEMPFSNIVYLQISNKHSNIMIMIQPDYHDRVNTIKYKFSGISEQNINSLNRSFTNSLKQYRFGFTPDKSVISILEK